MISLPRPVEVFGRRATFIAAGALLLLMGIILTKQAYADTSTVSESGKHVLTVYDGGVERGVFTEADTLGEALNEAGFKMNPNDVTEPELDEELVAASYEVNIYRARPVAVVDGNNRTKVMSPYRTAKQIAKQANMKLQDEDDVRLEYSVDVLKDGAVERLVIDRATPFTLVFYGKKIQSYTKAETVGDMLAERDISLKKNDTLSVKKGQKIKVGMTIELWRNGKQTTTKEESINFGVQQIQDADKKVGYRKVTTPGVKGKKTVTYEIIMKNGRELKRKAIKTVVTQKATKQVEIVGSKPSFGGDFGAALAKLRSCEGGYSSWNPAGPYYGAYQFDQRTWGSVSSAPYGSASPAEQDAAARALYERRGWSPWPSCGASLPDTYR